jgi:intein/homing endonuclease
VTKHLPGHEGVLVKVLTETGRSVIASQGNSFLTWNEQTQKFIPTNGSEIKVGHLIPVTRSLLMKEIREYLDLENWFPKTKYVFTSDIIKARPFFNSSEDEWNLVNGNLFQLPYQSPAEIQGRKRNYFLNCQDDLVFLPNSNVFISRITSRIILDEIFGFFIGYFCTKGVLLNDDGQIILLKTTPEITGMIFQFCDRYSIIRFVNKNDNKEYIKITSVLLSKLLRKICPQNIKGAINIPLFIHTTNQRFVRGFVDGFISGNASVKEIKGRMNIILSNLNDITLDTLNIIFSMK